MKLDCYWLAVAIATAVVLLGLWIVTQVLWFGTRGDEAWRKPMRPCRITQQYRLTLIYIENLQGIQSAAAIGFQYTTEGFIFQGRFKE